VAQASWFGPKVGGHLAPCYQVNSRHNDSAINIVIGVMIFFFLFSFQLLLFNLFIFIIIIIHPGIN